MSIFDPYDAWKQDAPEPEDEPREALEPDWDTIREAAADRDRDEREGGFDR